MARTPTPPSDVAPDEATPPSDVAPDEATPPSDVAPDEATLPSDVAPDGSVRLVHRDRGTVVHCSAESAATLRGQGFR
jgi:hypothetical protein